MSDADETTPAEIPAEATETTEADKPRTAKISLPDNPLSRPTDAAPRRAVGLPEEFIQRLASYGRSKGRPPVVRTFVASAEEEWRGEAPSTVSLSLIHISEPTRPY